MEWLKVLTLRCAFEAQESGELPGYLGSTVRGIMGHCFRRFVCHTPNVKCFRCDQREQCLYVKCFSNTGGTAGAVNPYTLHVHNQGKTQWKRGDVCTFDLTLFGNAAISANIYMDALMEMEHQGWGAMRIPFLLLRVTIPEYDRLVYDHGICWMRNLRPYEMKMQERNAGKVLVVFDTPVRIVSGKKLFDQLPFEMLIRFLYGRLHLLTKAYGQGPLPWLESELFQTASTITVHSQEWNNVSFSRYSINQLENRLDLPSKIGWALYEGNLTKVIPLLEAGKCVHVGKGATIGFGHYDLWYDQ